MSDDPHDPHDDMEPPRAPVSVNIYPAFRYGFIKQKCDCCDDETIHLHIQTAAGVEVHIGFPADRFGSFIDEVAKVVSAEPAQSVNGEFLAEYDYVVVDFDG